MTLSKTTNKNINHLESIKNDLQRGLAFIKNDKTVVCRKSSGTTTLEYKNNNEEHISPINKNAGSPIQIMENALDKVNRMIRECSG